MAVRRRRTSTRARVLCAITALVLTASAMLGLALRPSDSMLPAPSGTPARILYIPHSPISIAGNAEFTAANGVSGGNGSASDPYIIRGWDIVAGVSDFAAVFISSTDAFFRLEDCNLTHSDGNAVQLDYVSNGILINNSCTESINGIGLAFSQSTTIINNTLSRNGFHGIFMSASSTCLIQGNDCSNNSFFGIWLGVSNYNTISDNICSFHRTAGFEINSGIYLDSSTGNILTNNTCNGNTWNGISLYVSHGNVLVDNQCLGNNLHGISLAASTGNALIRNNCSRNQAGNITSGEEGGIYLNGGSNSNSLVGNICSDDTSVGIAVRASADNFLANNSCNNNTLAGIFVDSYDASAQRNTLINNTCLANPYGIMLWQYTSNNTIIGNNCSRNSIYGIYIAFAKNNSLTENTLLDNSGYGIYLISIDPANPSFLTANNTIWNNTFTGNNGATSTFDQSHAQAFDSGINNSWNSSNGFGNWWSDWTGPDVNMDGIVDLPYNLSGSAGAKDHFPRTNVQAPIPEFSSMLLVAVTMLSIVGAVRVIARAKD